MKRTIAAIILAAVLWFMMFSPWTAPQLDFWFTMSASAAVLMALSFVLDRKISKQFAVRGSAIALGVASAAVLYGIFYLGDYLSSLIIDFARDQVAMIYGLKSGGNPIVIAILLALLIGPAEEIFWRGFVQHRLDAHYGSNSAVWLTACIYGLVHFWSLNFMLIMSAFVCGLFWGYLYRYSRNLLTMVISHALWDVTVFVLLPI